LNVGAAAAAIAVAVATGAQARPAALLLFAGARPVPARDPFLEDSLRYVQP
jgi:hypothetical protein